MIVAVLFVCAAADVAHLVGRAGFVPVPAPVVPGYVGNNAPTGRPIAILRQSQDVSPDGSYQWA